MDTFLFAVNAVLPLVVLIMLGYFLRRINLIDDNFLSIGNKLTFRVFLPVLLFYNVYNINGFGDINWTFIAFGVAMIFIVLILSTVFVVLFEKDNRRRGVLIQAMYRSNFALIGIPLVTMLYGEGGAADASFLSAFTIPIFNISAVIVLSVFGNGKKVKPSKVLKEIATNGLIIGVLLGVVMLGVRALFESAGIGFRLKNIEFLYTSIKYVSTVATPFALIVLGGRFRISAVKTLWKPILVGTLVRTVVVPAVALVAAYLLFPQFGGQHFASYIALFGTPVAVSSAIMVKEMGGDDDLAGQLVVWTTVASGITLFIQIVILKQLGAL